MLDRRYQVFVSSTYEDLKEERQGVLHAVLDARCIPIGMESFPANDSDSWRFIEAIIKDCDYYVLVLGGKYGSVTKEGISFTQKEYRYAVEQQIPVLAFPYDDLAKLPGSKLELDPERRKKLEDLRHDVCNNHTIRKWTTTDGLKHAVLQALSQAVLTNPREGWIRGRYAMNTESLNELETLRRRVAEFVAADQVDTTGLASGSDEFLLRYTLKTKNGPNVEHQACTVTWDELFECIGPELLTLKEEDVLGFDLCRRLVRIGRIVIPDGVSAQTYPNRDDVEAILLQLAALGLTEQDPVMKRGIVSWQLTPVGRKRALKIVAFKKSSERLSASSENNNTQPKTPVHPQVFIQSESSPSE